MSDSSQTNKNGMHGDDALQEFTTDYLQHTVISQEGLGIMSIKKSGICGNSEKNIVIPKRRLHYFLLFLVLVAVACQIPGASALSPSPYFPVPGWSVKNYYGGYPSHLFSFEIGKNVTNGGGPGNVFYNMTGTYPLRSKVFWMDAGENVKVWAYYPYSISAGFIQHEGSARCPGGC